MQAGRTKISDIVNILITRETAYIRRIHYSYGKC